MTAKLTALQTDLLTRIAIRRDAGQHTWGSDILDIPTRTVTSATKRGLIEASTNGGWVLTDAGWAAIDWEAPATVKASGGSRKRRSKSPRPCACKCGGTTGGGLRLPGHDARAAGHAGRRVATVTDSHDNTELAEFARRWLPAEASEALVAKAVRVALTVLAKQAAA